MGYSADMFGIRDTGYGKLDLFGMRGFSCPAMAEYKRHMRLICV
jgi:hypothetical protein